MRFLIFTIFPAPRTEPNTKEAIDKYLFNECMYVWMDGWMKNQKKYVLLCSHLFSQERSGVCQGKNEGTGGT